MTKTPALPRLAESALGAGAVMRVGLERMAAPADVSRSRFHALIVSMCVPYFANPYKDETSS